MTVVVCFAGLILIGALCRWSYVRLKREFTDAGNGGDGNGGRGKRVDSPAGGPDRGG